MPLALALAICNHSPGARLQHLSVGGIRHAERLPCTRITYVDQPVEFANGLLSDALLRCCWVFWRRCKSTGGATQGLTR